MLRFRTTAALIIALSLFALASASASASVAYIDGNEVWVSSDDGARKLRLSAGEGDWREVAQSDQGYIVGTRREAGKIAQLASFTVWDPSGKLVRFGSLSGDIGCSNAYPLSLDITPSGGNLVYGFSCYTYGFPVGSLVNGTYLKVSADATTGVPLKLYSGQYPTLVGTRILARTSDTTAGVQDASSIGSDTFTNWISFTLDPGHLLNRSDASADGTIVASEVRNDSTIKIDRVIMSKWGAFGTNSYVDDCNLPISGDVVNPSVSQDGASVTWADARGVLLAGTPAFNGPADCQLTRPPVVLSATGTYPSYGPFNVPAPQPTKPVAPTVTIPKSLQLAAAIKSGLTIKVTSAVGGKAKATLTIKPSKVGKRGKKAITLATGSVKVTAGKTTRLKLKFTKAGKKLKKKLRNKKLTLKVTVGGATTTRTIKLK